MLLKYQLSEAEYQARLAAFIAQLLTWPVKGEAYKNDDDQWEKDATPPIEELTDETIELAAAFLQPEAYKQFTGRENAPSAASDVVWLWVLEQQDEIRAIWQQLLDNGEFWRPDYLIATLVDALDDHIETICNQMQWEVFNERGALYRDFSKNEKYFRRVLPAPKKN